MVVGTTAPAPPATRSVAAAAPLDDCIPLGDKEFGAVAS
jgi:hypothetical protein